jgi:uncharacterized membrane protein
MFVLWLLVLVLLGVVLQLNRRVGHLEGRLAEMDARQVGFTLDDRVASQEPAIEPELRALPETQAPLEPAERPQVAPTVLVADDRSLEEVSASNQAEPAVEEQKKAAPRIGFEELFGRRLPIWAGGITLAVAGILIVRYSIEAGLLSPALRVAAGLLFGFGLIGGAEAARRRSDQVEDPRVAQALSGAGIATLYGILLVAANLYGLIGSGLAMVGMTLVTGLAMLLSVRFGAPSALLGLAGGLAAPALIGSDQPNVPLLTLYLALAVGGLTALSARQRWGWLGISALTGGFGWGLLLLLGGALDVSGTLALGGYLLLLGLLLPGLGMAGDHRARVQLVAALLTALQMSALLATGGFALLHWGLFGLLAVGVQWLAWRNPELRPLPAMGAIIFALLAGVWPEPAPTDFLLVGSIGLLIFVAPAAWRLWRPGGGLLEVGQIAGLAIAALAVPLRHYHLLDGSRDTLLGMLALALAGGVAGLASAGWTKAARRYDARFALLAVASTLLLCGASGLLLPWWLVAGTIAAIGFGLLLLGQKADDLRLEPVAWSLLGAGILLPFYGAIFGDGSALDMEDAARFGLLALIAAAFAWRGRVRQLRQAAQVGMVLTAVLAAGEVMPDRWLPLVPAAMLLCLGLFAASRNALVRPAILTGLALSLMLAVEPLLFWVGDALSSLGGDPMLMTGAAEPFEALVHLVVPALAAAAGCWLARASLKRREHFVLAAIALLAAAGLHSLYKGLFALDSYERWEMLGLAERLVWAGLLVGGAVLLWRRQLRRPALWLGATGLAYHAWYSLFLHNPLWSIQAVGELPLLNLLLPLYLVPLAALYLARERLKLPAEWRRGGEIAFMLLILGLGFSLLRQAFSGTLLTAASLSQAEDIARSILAIAAAIGFLLWGIRSSNRDWRIASLVLMLGAALKVFLFDASGLEGLVRIASFVALGFSLIGIGWLYARQLRREEPAGAAA